MNLSNQAMQVLKSLRDAYVAKGYPPIYNLGFTPEPGQEAAYGELAARKILEQTDLNGGYKFTDHGVQTALDLS